MTKGVTNLMRTYLVGLLLAMGLCSSAIAQEGRAFVQQTCAKCHGIQGISQSGLFPRLAAQPAKYIIRQLRGMREQSRTDPHAQAYMWQIARTLSDHEIEMVAEYFARQKPAAGRAPVSKELAAQGQRLFEKGAIMRDVPACAGCHGLQAEGKDNYPRLAGQHATYLFRQIQDFRSGVRPNSEMHENAFNVTDEEAIALAEYLSALGPHRPGASEEIPETNACTCPDR